MQKKLHFSHQLQGVDVLSIKIQEDDFDPGLIYNLVGKDRKDIGAKVAFTGLVKDFFELDEVTNLYIEHYPSMAKAQLKNICQSALERWQIKEIHLVHRFGLLKPGDNIVNLVLASHNRSDVFQGGTFIMDYLKSDAPFWKKEFNRKGSAWVNQSLDDIQKMDLW